MTKNPLSDGIVKITPKPKQSKTLLQQTLRLSNLLSDDDFAKLISSLKLNQKKRLRRIVAVSRPEKKKG